MDVRIVYWLYLQYIIYCSILSTVLYLQYITYSVLLKVIHSRFLAKPLVLNSNQIVALIEASLIELDFFFVFIR